ncbi:hypothetical protein DKX38_003230 [Salix brachista]|uniref:Pentatricopeptide repeat-containing protein n=1 Tax=Salix brachista TaxID=2182728 RepID=A0A5N5NQW8_9ROSI|nr:hypothetical protein DKX38_003230 [Salix brachista]
MADALIAFDKIYDAGIVPNRATTVNALGRNEWELEVIMGTSIDVYLKCGRIDEGLKAFRSMEEKNVYAWNAIIQGLDFAVSGREAVLVVQQNGARRVWEIMSLWLPCLMLASTRGRVIWVDSGLEELHSSSVESGRLEHDYEPLSFHAQK